jgi:probable rRNA maturation factor
MRPSTQPLEIIRCSTFLLPVPADTLYRTARLLYKSENVPLLRRVIIIFCPDSAIRRLNAQYRGIDRATDVLSFAFGDDDLLGEIYISPCRAAVQAKRYGFTRQEEIVRLFIHGFYHLLGYDHTAESGRNKMEKKEKTAFNKIVCAGN